MKKPSPKRRNPVARQLRSPVFRKRVVHNRKTYRRNGRGGSKARETVNTEARP